MSPKQASKEVRNRTVFLSILGGIFVGAITTAITPNDFLSISVGIISALLIFWIYSIGRDLTNAPLASVAIGDLIKQVKSAVETVNKKEPRIVVTTLELTLQTVVEKTVGVDAQTKLKVPIGEQTFQMTGNIKNTETQTVTVKLAPPPPQKGSRATAEMIDVEKDIAAAIEEVLKGINKAENGAVPLVLTESSIELKFVVKKDGKISIVVFGEVSNELTNTVKLTFYDSSHKPPTPAPPTG